MTEEVVVQGPLRAGSPLRTPRAAAVAGIIFSVLLITALVLLRVSVPAHPAVPGAWLTDSRRRTTVAIALNLIPFAGIAFLWFVGVVRDRIGEREDRFFATVFLGSGLLFVGMLFVGAAVAGGLIAGQTQSESKRISSQASLQWSSGCGGQKGTSKPRVERMRTSCSPGRS